MENFGNLRRNWKIGRLHTYTICDHDLQEWPVYFDIKKIVHSLTRARKPLQPIRRNSSSGLDESTLMEPWNLTPTLEQKTSSPTTMVQNPDVYITDEPGVKKPKITRHGAISRNIFSRDRKPVEHKQKPRTPKKSKQVCTVKDTLTLL